MSTKYTQEALLKMARENSNTYIVANEGRLELRMNAPLNIVEAARAIPPNVANNLREGAWDKPQVNPNEILHNMLDHIHDGNREELVGELILMLGWLHKGGTMPNISKDTVTSTTLWIIPTND